MIIAKKAAPWLFAAAFALFASVAPGQADVTTPPSENPFAATDQNDDGAINSEEYRYRMLETFVLLDEDGNGVLTISETTFTDPADFDRVDANRDGKITIREFLIYSGYLFEIADVDEDGDLSPGEVDAFDSN